ncbi:hypothetical protein CEXT_474021 [Caerostris extrusa]|uniref:Uncharacterized protein n=1 Tax=Caerostris extrusa TaxID=172846 RepID=A0AAV4WFS8_CAEEX|nr:hypothetical protein CEXT_474021 [Caerostris extrusa]
MQTLNLLVPIFFPQFIPDTVTRYTAPYVTTSLGLSPDKKFTCRRILKPDPKVFSSEALIGSRSVTSKSSECACADSSRTLCFLRWMATDLQDCGSTRARRSFGTKFSHGSVTESGETIAFMMPNSDGTNTEYPQREVKTDRCSIFGRSSLPASRVNYFCCRSMFREEMPPAMATFSSCKLIES